MPTLVTLVPGDAVLFLLLCNLHIANAIPIDNGVIAQPDIECLQDSMRILVSTANPFHGHVYIKGMFQIPGCHLDLTGQRPGGDTSVPYEVPYRGCILVTRERSVNPAGLSYTATVIVQFHHLFLTKVDRAYSMLPTTQITSQRRMPTCGYSVVAGHLNGPVVRFARVGDKVFHKWSCEEGVHGMLVHSCIARDGAGTAYRLIDDRGCAIDPVALGELSYANDLFMAWAQVHVFKFADQMLVTFQCEITLCVKSANGCEGITPPLCSGSGIGPYAPAPIPQIPVPPGPYLPEPLPARPVPFPSPIAPPAQTESADFYSAGPPPPPLIQVPFVPPPQPLAPPGPPVIDSGPHPFPAPRPFPIEPPLTFRPPFGPLFDDDYRFRQQDREIRSAVDYLRARQPMDEEMRNKNSWERKDTLDLSTEDILVFNLDETYPDGYLPTSSNHSNRGGHGRSLSAEDICMEKLTLTQIVASIILFFTSLLVLLAFCQRRYYLDKITQAKRRSSSY